MNEKRRERNRYFLYNASASFFQTSQSCKSASECFNDASIRNSLTSIKLGSAHYIFITLDCTLSPLYSSNENYIDLDRMLAEKGGKFQFDSYGMHDGAGDGPIRPTRIHKYDFSDPAVIEVISQCTLIMNFSDGQLKIQKVKSRRPKDPLTPHQVAALTSVVTHHQLSTFPTSSLSSPQQIQSPHTWIDDYNRRQVKFQNNRHQYRLPTHSSISYSRENPNLIQSLLPNYRSNIEQNTKS